MVRCIPGHTTLEFPASLITGANGESRSKQWAEVGTAPAPQAPPLRPAMMHGAMYLAALQTQSESLLVQQAAVSVAAHGVLESMYNTSNPEVRDVIDDKLDTVLSHLSSDGCYTAEIIRARSVGRKAAEEVLTKRVDPCFHEPPEFVWSSPQIGVYQPTEGQGPVPPSLCRRWRHNSLQVSGPFRDGLGRV